MLGHLALEATMFLRSPRIASTSSWLATFAYAYLAFVASTRLMKTAVRWAAALTGASVAYVLLMLVFAGIWQRDPVHAASYCAVAMTIAVPFACWVASTILRPEHRRAGAWTCTALAMLYPVALAVGSEPDTPVRAMQYLYVAASAIGGMAVALALAPPRTVRAGQAAHQSVGHLA